MEKRNVSAAAYTAHLWMMGKFMDQWKWYMAQIKWNKWKYIAAKATNGSKRQKDDKWTTCDKWREIIRERRRERKKTIFPKCCKLSAHNLFLFMFLFFFLHFRSAINSIVIAVDCNVMLQHGIINTCTTYQNAHCHLYECRMSCSVLDVPFNRKSGAPHFSQCRSKCSVCWRHLFIVLYS